MTTPNVAIRLLLSTERAVTRVSVFAACGFLAAAACVGFYQVLARFLLAEPVTWSESFVRVTLIWMAYMGLCGAMRTGALVSVDVLYRMCKGTARRVLQAAIAASTISLLVILVWYGTILTQRVQFQVLAGLEISVSWAYAAIPVGAAVSILAVLAHFFDPKREELENAV